MIADKVALGPEAKPMPVKGAGQQIHTEVTRWEEIEHARHRFGGTEYVVGHREIGHVHGDSLVDIPFPLSVRHELVERGAAEPHHILPNSGWVSIFLRNPPDVENAVRLLRKSYEIALASRAQNKQLA
jgi:hypothetical protein